MIEERMRQILLEKREVRSLEMMPANAASMLLHCGQPIASEMLESSRQGCHPDVPDWRVCAILLHVIPFSEASNSFF